jgi:exosortase
LTTLSPHTSASLTVGGDEPLPLARSDARGPVYYGLSLATWIKIGVITILMVALYRFNLARLWAKTNPINGQGSFEHAIFVPMIGLYYLYVWRDALVSPSAAQSIAAPVERWTLPGIWTFLHVIPALLILVGVPFFFGDLFAGVLSFNPQVVQAELAQLPVTPALVGLLLFSLGGAVYLYIKGNDLKFPTTQLWLTNVWHGLGTWLLAALTVLGFAFFVWVAAPARYATALVPVRWAVGLLAVAAAGFIAYQGGNIAWRRRYDAVLSRSAGWFGGFVMVWGILFSLWGIWPGQNDFFKDVGMVVSLFGVALLLTGWRVMRVAWFPIVFLFCALPWPDQVYSWVAMPLQNFAAKVGVFVLIVAGVDAGQNGTKMWMRDAAGVLQVLNVEEACAGLRSLMTFVSVAAAVAFLSSRLLWQKLVLVASAVPIAILCNACRVAGQGLLHRYASPEWSRDFAHGFAGLVMLIPGFFLILLISWVIDHLFIEEADEPVRPTKLAVRPAAAVATAAASPVATAAVTRTQTVPAAVIKIPRPAPTAAAAAPPAALVPAVAPAVVAAKSAAAQPVAARVPVAGPQPSASPVSPVPVRPATVRQPAPVAKVANPVVLTKPVAGNPQPAAKVASATPSAAVAPVRPPVARPPGATTATPVDRSVPSQKPPEGRP